MGSLRAPEETFLEGKFYVSRSCSLSLSLSCSSSLSHTLTFSCSLAFFLSRLLFSVPRSRSLSPFPFKAQPPNQEGRRERAPNETFSFYSPSLSLSLSLSLWFSCALVLSLSRSLFLPRSCSRSLPTPTPPTRRDSGVVESGPRKTLSPLAILFSLSPLLLLSPSLPFS